ncbi:MAG TPA: hypothetical protein VI138_00140 [Candidatus Dormibacteraeota bacterium]
MTHLAIRLTVPAVVLAVSGAVVLAGFGYDLFSGLVAAAVVLALGVVTLLHRPSVAVAEDSSWWR